MKVKLLIIGTIILNFYAIEVSCQEIQLPINSETNLIEYTEIVIVDSIVTQIELYTRAREWIAVTFKSANDVIQMDDKSAGIIIAKGIIPIQGGMYLTDGKVDFTLKVQLKDGRYRYWVTNFIHSSYKPGYSGGALENLKPSCGNFNMMKKGWSQVKETTDNTVNSMILSLKNSLKADSKKSDNENW